MNNTVSLMVLNDQSQMLLRLRNDLDEQNILVTTNNRYQLERAKMIGMLEMARAFDMNIDTYRWVYAC